MKLYLLVALSGAIGSVLRYSLYVITPKIINYNFPISTIFVNLVGSFFIGFSVVFFNKNIFPMEYKIFVIYGLLGGFTTYSSFSLDLFNLLDKGSYIYAFNYIFITVIFGLIFFYFGRKFADFL